MENIVNLSQTLLNFENKLHMLLPNSNLFFNPGLSDSDISLIESLPKSEYINDLLTLFKWHDGQTINWTGKKVDHSMFAFFHSPALFPIKIDNAFECNYSFWNLRTAISAYMSNTASFSNLDDYECEGADEGIDPVFWSDMWIPFAGDGCGNNLCFDLTSGKLITFVHSTKRRFFANSIEEYFKTYTKWLDKFVQIERIGDKISFLSYGMSLKNETWSIDCFNPENLPEDDSAIGFNSVFGFMPYSSLSEWFGWELTQILKDFGNNLDKVLPV